MFHRLKNDFRLSIITLLGLSAVFGITPFALVRLWQGDMMAGLVDMSIMLGISSSVFYAWSTGDTKRSGMLLAVIACGGAIAIATIVGEPGLFWLYPCLVTTFFLVNPRLAGVLNLLSIVALMMVDKAFSSTVHMWSFAATAVMVSLCAYVYAHRNHSQRKRLRHLATIDPLTGIKNRRSMDEELNLAAANAERSGLPYALVILDLDYFKKINDRYGHHIGDKVLTDLVALLEHNTRRSDHMFRYGGEEFVLLLPGVDGASARTVMASLQAVIQKRLRHPGGSVTASFGVAQLGHGESVASWLARADSALYAAKESGRNRIVFADEPGQPMLGSA